MFICNTNVSQFTRSLDGIFDDGKYKNTIKRMHLAGWKDNYFSSAGISITGHGCGISQFSQFYDKSIKI